MEEKIVKVNLVSAEEARKTADTTTKLLSRLNKAIKEGAEEGMTVIRWCVNDYSPVLLTAVSDELKKAGYLVELRLDKENQIGELTISW